MFRRFLTVVMLMVISVAFAGCATMTPAGKGAAYGAAAGAAAGQVIGGDTESTLIGTGVGAVGGAVVGEKMRREKQEAYEQGVRDASR